MRVKWLKNALKNLDAEISYIAQEDKDVALKIYAHIISCIENLEQFPNSGRPGRVFGTREMVIEKYPYIIPYRVKDDVVEILRVFHTSRKQPIKW